MRIKTRRFLGAAVVLAALFPLGAVPAQASGGGITVVATGLNNPRGLHFGPDGQLYVAEGGLGGDRDEHRRTVPAGPATGRSLHLQW